MKALASDFDGTLYVNGKIDSKDVEAINQFQKDNLFGICTGRPIKHMVYFLTDHFKSDFYITSTGSYILDKELNVLYESALSYKVIHSILKEYGEKYPMYLHVGKEDLYSYQKYIPGFDSPQILFDLDTMPKEHIMNASLKVNTQEQAKIIQNKLMEVYGNQVDVFINDIYVDIVNKGVSKGKACQWIKNYYKIDTLYGIGDNYNDIFMFKSCDYSFSFTYSPMDVQNQSTYVVDSINRSIEICQTND